MTKLYDIALNNRSRYVDALFTYEADTNYDVGDIVLVPFGMANKIVVGIIVQEVPIEKKPKKLKKIIRKLDEMGSLDPSSVQIALHIKDEYICSYYDAFKLFLPPSGYSKKNENHTFIIEVIDGLALDKYTSTVRKNAKNKLAFLEALKKYERIRQDEFENAKKIKIKPYVDELLDLGIVDMKRINVHEKNPWQGQKSKKIILNAEQQQAYDRIVEGYEKKDFTPTLLHGVTGSGKTAVYIEMVKHVLSKGKRALILVPEISLTMQTIDRFTGSFDEDIAVIHSGLTKRQKFDQWVKIKQGFSKIIIGARSALFSPIDDLGAIIIDEFHDSSYKSERPPKYDTVELSEYIARKKEALLILSSATPSISAYYKAQKNQYNLINIENRANKLPMPQVEIVDMLNEMKTGNITDISRHLQEEINLEIAKGNQAILFINKRGYSNNLTCDNCGHVVKCPNCDITLTYHSYDETLKCHYCGYTQRVQRKCEECEDGHYIMMNTGTQKVETQVRSLFPKAKVFRLDKDTANTKDELYKILDEFKNQDGSILIGTQMIGKGHDFENVTLVGVIDADKGMNSPAYTALERSFNMIEQVAGRAGRGDVRGKVIVQTYAKNNPIFSYICRHDYRAFYEDEIQKRQIYSYEPFGNLIGVTVISKSEDEARASSYKIQDALTFYNEKKLNNKLKVYNAEPCLITKIDGKYRYRIVIRAGNDILKRAKKMIDYTLSAKRKVVLTSDNVSVSVDVNPENML